MEMHRTTLRRPSRVKGIWPTLVMAAFCLLATSEKLAATGRDQLGDVNYSLTITDVVLLEDLQRRSFLFFQEQTDPKSGLTHDRALLAGGVSEAPASVAGSGFALTAWCIADKRGWISREEARERVLRTVRFVATQVEHERGWLYHFVDVQTGKRHWDCEVSTVDTALYLKGAIFAREYFQDAEITRWVDATYRRIDWQWALNGGSTLSHGWMPETGFLETRWDQFAEMMGLYLLGLGAETDALPAGTWRAWRREPEVSFGGRTFVHCPPLFTHQYAHAWFDFRNKRDRGLNYWDNSVSATLAQREWCAGLGEKFPGWSMSLWGVTASDSPDGYKAWGGPQSAFAEVDGTLAPCAAAGSLPFAPKECLEALHAMRELALPGIWGRYGFTDAFNLSKAWVSPDALAIDVGITLMMAENLRSGMVWEYFMRAPEVRRGMRVAGFQSENTTTSGGVLAMIGVGLE